MLYVNNFDEAISTNNVLQFADDTETPCHATKRAQLQLEAEDALNKTDQSETKTDKP